MKKPYRSTDFNNERKWKSKYPFDDVTQVGKQKAIGYWPWHPGEDTEEIRELVFAMLNSDKMVILTKSTSKSHMDFPVL